MASLISLSIKGSNGKYKNYTVAINDEVNKYGQNVSMWEEQSKEQREAKTPKKYIGNGRVVWTNGENVSAAPIKKSESAETVEDDMPF